MKGPKQVVHTGTLLYLITGLGDSLVFSSLVCSFVSVVLFGLFVLL